MWVIGYYVSNLILDDLGKKKVVCKVFVIFINFEIVLKNFKCKKVIELYLYINSLLCFRKLYIILFIYFVIEG